MMVTVHFILAGKTNWRTVTVIHEVNIIEVYQQRVFTNLPAKGLITDIECEAKDREQLEGLIANLNKAGYDVRQVEVADWAIEPMSALGAKDDINDMSSLFPLPPQLWSFQRPTAGLKSRPAGGDLFAGIRPPKISPQAQSARLQLTVYARTGSPPRKQVGREDAQIPTAKGQELIRFE
jgi:hypothetical protein